MEGVWLCMGRDGCGQVSEVKSVIEIPLPIVLLCNCVASQVYLFV